jgi:hypothetical protein
LSPVEIAASVAGLADEAYSQSAAHGISYRDGGQGIYTWNAEIQRIAISASS